LAIGLLYLINPFASPLYTTAGRLKHIKDIGKLFKA